MVDPPTDLIAREPVIHQILLGKRFDAMIGIDQAVAAQGHQAIGLGSSRQRGEPAVTDRVIVGKEMRGRHLEVGEIAHHQWLRLPVASRWDQADRTTVDEAFHRGCCRCRRGPQLHGDVDAFMEWIPRQHQMAIGQVPGGVDRSAMRHLVERTPGEVVDQSVDWTVVGCQAQIAEQMIEGPVFHHDDDDGFDISKVDGHLMCSGPSFYAASASSQRAVSGPRIYQGFGTEET